jgi:hypothetical protein
MFASLVLCAGLGVLEEYRGIPYLTLCEILEYAHAHRQRSQDLIPLLRAQGAFKPESFPLYLRILTLESDDPRVPSQERWDRLQFAVGVLIAECEGDHREFISVGIRLLGHPSYGRRLLATSMLVDIATPKDAAAVAAVIDPDDPKNVPHAMEAAKVLSVIGGESELKLLDALVKPKHAQADKEALVHITASRELLRKRVEGKERPEKK